MKKCPQCGREYDLSMSFCLDDGAELLYGPASEPQTAILHETPPPDEAATRAQISTSASNRAAKPLIAAGVAVALLIGAFVGYRYLPTSAGQIDSIAVMPFENASGNPDLEYLSDGMTETLIASLSQLPNLSVKPRSSVFRFKGKDPGPQSLGKELNVQAVLTGRVVQRGDQLTLALELVDVRKDRVIWSEQYNRRQADLVSLQAEIARDVSSKLKARLSGAEEERLTKTYTANTEAYQLYLKGRFYWNKRTAENIRKAIEMFQQAADTDPNYALAYAGLADCYVVLGDYTGLPESETVPKMQAFAQRALQIDDSLAEAHTSLAYSYVQQWKWDEGEREFKRAIELNPRYATAHHWYYLCLLEMGRGEEAFAMVKRAQELDPLSPIISFNVATVYIYVRGDIDAAIRESTKLIEFEPNFARGHEVLGLAYLLRKRYPEALAALNKAVELSPSDRQLLRDLGYGYAVAGKRDEAVRVLKDLQAKYERREAFGQDVAAVYAGLGDLDQAFAWIEKDVQARSGRLGRIFYQIPFESVRGDPRYAEVRRRMGASP
jgi:TolB-like protein/Flp pilus assembly protein TadD